MHCVCLYWPYLHIHAETNTRMWVLCTCTLIETNTWLLDPRSPTAIPCLQHTHTQTQYTHKWITQQLSHLEASHALPQTCCAFTLPAQHLLCRSDLALKIFDLRGVLHTRARSLSHTSSPQVLLTALDIMCTKSTTHARTQPKGHTGVPTHSDVLVL